MRNVVWQDDRFFFQAEDGIRERNVTGVQTCALPIYGPVLASVGPAPNTPRTVTRFWLPSTRPKPDVRGTSAGPTLASTGPSALIAARAICRIVQPRARA